jgi:hypothetical protein
MDTDPNVESAHNMTLLVGGCHLFARLDLAPNNPSNPVQLSLGTHVTVVLISTATFKASNVQPKSARFGLTGTEAAPAASAKWTSR